MNDTDGSQVKPCPGASIGQPKFQVDGWDARRHDFQSWLKRAPWGVLRDTEYGVRQPAPSVHPAMNEDDLVAHIHRIDIATFLTAERISYLGISRLVSVAPDEASQVFLTTQAADEARHFEVFCKRLADRGLTPDERNDLMETVTTPAMRKFYDLINEQVDKSDFAAAMLAHNIVLEGMAYPVYRYEQAYWSVFDPLLSQLIKGAFSDEVNHVGFGEAIIRRYTALGNRSRARLQRLAREFFLLMSDVFQSTIDHYIHLYQLVADQYIDDVGHIEIFKGRRMREVPEQEQVKILMAQVREEHSRRLERIGLAA